METLRFQIQSAIPLSTNSDRKGQLFLPNLAFQHKLINHHRFLYSDGPSRP